MSVSVLLPNVCPLIAEGPHWEEATQSLLFVDILAKQVHRWNRETGHDQIVQLGELRPACAGRADFGRDAMGRAVLGRHPIDCDKPMKVKRVYVYILKLDYDFD